MRYTWWWMSCQLLDYPTKEIWYVYVKSKLDLNVFLRKWLDLNVLIEMESILTHDLLSHGYLYCIAFFHIWVSLHASSISYVLTSLLSWVMPLYCGFRYGISGRHRSLLGTLLSLLILVSLIYYLAPFLMTWSPIVLGIAGSCPNISSKDASHRGSIYVIVMTCLILLFPDVALYGFYEYAYFWIITWHLLKVQMFYEMISLPLLLISHIYEECKVVCWVK